METIRINSNGQTKSSKAGAPFLTALMSMVIIGGTIWVIYDRETHGKMWFWNRLREENRLREQLGEKKLNIIEQINGLLVDKSESW